MRSGSAGSFTVVFDSGICCQVEVDAAAGTASGSFGIVPESLPAAGIKRDIVSYAGALPVHDVRTAACTSPAHAQAC
jgi:hypothetical protein